MVALVGGNSIGLSLTSLTTLGQQGVWGQAQQGRNGERAYVNVTNGNLVFQDRDEQLVGHGLAFSIVRTYNSEGSFPSNNADHWSTGTPLKGVKLSGQVNKSGSRVTRTDQDGAVTVYAYDTARGLYVNTDGGGAYNTIRYDSATTNFVWTEGSTGMTERYASNGSGPLLSATDTSGNTVVYKYNTNGTLSTVTDASGEVVSFVYGSNQRITEVRTTYQNGSGTSTLTRVRYGYDSLYRLTQVTVDLSPEDNSVADGNAYTTNYTYDGTSSRITSITQSDGTSVQLSYVLVGTDYRVATFTDGLGQVTQFTYDTVNRKTTVTDPLGLVSTYEYDAKGQLTRATAPAVGGVQQITSFAYDGYGNVTQVVDPLGNAVAMAYDANGNQTLQRDALGNTITRTFGATFNQLLTETVYAVPASGSTAASQPQTTRYVYDAQDRLRFVISAEGRVTEHRYASTRERIATVQYDGGSYNVSGLAVTAVPTEAQMATWATAQDKTLIQRADMVYDFRGQLSRVKTYSAVDASGNGVAGGKAETVYVYDQAGQLLQTVSPLAGVTSYTYDGLGRVRTVTDALNNSAVTTYDDAHNATVVRLANGLTTTSSYDKAGRLALIVQSDAASQSLGQTQYFYDADGRLLMTVDPTGVRHQMLYDEAGRKVADVDATGALTEYRYDADNRLTCSIAYATRVVVSALLDAAGNPLNPTLASVRPGATAQDHANWWIYDAAGRLVKTVNALGAVTETRYDGAGHVVMTLGYANTVDVSGFGNAPTSAQASPAVSAADRIERRFYDNDGLLRGSLDAEGYLTEYRYDSGARLVSTLRYATATAASLRTSGSLSQLIPAGAANDIKAYTLYNARGQVAGTVDGEGYLAESVYDLNGNLARTIRYATAVTYSAGATLASLRPASTAKDQVRSYTYTALNQLDTATDEQGVVTTYVYDKIGNLLQTSRAVGTNEVRTLTSRYDLQGRLIGQLSGEGSALLTGNQSAAEIDAVWAQYGTAYTYDAAGRRTSMVDANGNRAVFYYDTDGRLTYAINAQGDVQARDYDALGQLAASTQLARRVPAATLAGLGGGIADAGTVGLLDGLRDASRDAVQRYTYNTTGTLATQADELGNVTRFGYDAFGEQTSRTSPLDDLHTVLSTREYDRRGLLSASTDDVGGIAARVALEYDAFGRATRTIDANGNATRQSYDRLGRVITTTDPLNASRSTSYDAFDRVLTSTDALGAVTRYSYDDAQRSITVTSPEGVVVTTVRSRHGQTQSITDGNGNVTQYSYDRNGNLVGTATPLTTSTSTYDHANRLVETTDANGNKVHYDYDAANRVLRRHVDPNGLDLVTSYEYDALGRRVLTTDANGVATVLEYDRKGQVLTQTVDPDGLALRTVYTYDAQGRTLTVTSPGGTLTQYVYDALGRRTEEHVDPQGLDLTRRYAYDSVGNVLWARDANGNVTRYQYDQKNRVALTLDAAGGVTINTYDADDRLLRRVSLATPLAGVDALALVPDWAAVKAQLHYDSAIDATQLYRYDHDGRMRFSVDGAGGVTERRYDGDGNVTELIGYATKLPSIPSTDDPLWVPVPSVDSAHDQHLRTVYDALDRAVYSVDATGSLAVQRYDGLGNVRERIAYAAKQPAAIGATKAQLDALVAGLAIGSSDAHVRRTYDAANRLSDSVDGVGAVTRFDYDRDGNLIQQTRYATAIGASAEPSSVAASDADRTTRMAYDAANRLVYQLDAFGAVSENVYDDNGNVVRQARYDVQIPAGTVPTVDAIALLLPSNAATTRYNYAVYDAADRMRFAIDAEGYLTETRYDANGNAVAHVAYGHKPALTGVPGRISLDDALALPQIDANHDRASYAVFDAANRQVYGVDAMGFVKATVYDALGRVSSSTGLFLAIADSVPRTLADLPRALVTDARDRSQHFSYDAAGRLASSTDALTHSESFSYDALGNKLTFTNKNGATWTYDYDAGGRLVKESSPLVKLTTVQVDTATGKLVAGAEQDAAVVTVLEYDALGNLTARTEGYGRAEQRTTRYQYDALGRQVKTIFPNVALYDAASDPLSTSGSAARYDVSAAEISSETRYNALGDAIASRDVSGNWSYKTYDGLGQVAYDIDAEGYVTSYVRDGFGNVTGLTRYAAQTNLAGGSGGELSSGHVRTTLDGLAHDHDRVIETQYDKLDRAIRVTEPIVYSYDSSAAAGQSRLNAGKTTVSAYDAFGQLVQQSVLLNDQAQTWARTTHYFDRRGYEYATIDALGYVTLTEHDAVGNVTVHTELANATQRWDTEGWDAVAYTEQDRTTNYGYDLANRKASETRLQVEVEDGSRQDLLTAYGYDAVGNLTRTTDAAQGNTYSYYDALGRVVAVAAPTRAATSLAGELTPLTSFQRDVYGNVLVQVEHAGGALSGMDENHFQTTDGDDDHRTVTRFDVDGHALDVMDANGYMRHMSYDAAGRVRKQWQAVTGADGTQTSFEATSYDRLGHAVQIVNPGSDSVVVAGMTSQVTSAVASYDENGRFSQWLGENSVRFEWAGVVDPQGGQVRVQIDYQTVDSVQTLSYVDDLGNTITSSTGSASTAASQVRTLSVADVVAGTTIGWTDGGGAGGISSLTYVRVWQQDASGNWVIRFGQAGGDLGSHIVAGSASLVHHQVDYNAFGEVTQTSVDGQRAEYYDRDGAGRVWRTNSGDGVDKVMLYDVAGNVSAEIRSTTVGAIAALRTAQDADLLSGTRRTETRYDLLGRAVEQILPERSTAGVGLRGAVAQSTSYSTAVLSSTTANVDESGNVTSWSGQNQIRFNWSDLGVLGNGAVKVQVDSVTSDTTVPVYDESGNPVRDESGNMLTQAVPGFSRSHTELLTSAANTGATITFGGEAFPTVTHVRVWKQDAGGNWQLMIDGGASDTGTRIVIPRPTDAVGAITVQVRQVGQSAWSDAPTIDFGDALLLADSALAAGNYEYQILYAGPQDSQATVKGGGQIAFTVTVLATIGGSVGFATATSSVLGWADPGSGVVQTFHYRAVGSSAWLTAGVAAQGSGRSGVDLAGLAPGSYEYELLYTQVGQSHPFAHATGNVAVNAGTPPQVVPPVGTPHLATSLSVASATVVGTIVGYDESGAPVISGSQGAQATTVVQWSSSFAGPGYDFRLRAVGASQWTSVAIQAVGEIGTDESGNSVTAAAVDIGALGLAAGSYEIELRDVASGSNAHLTATLTIAPATNGHYETVTVAVQVPVTVTPEDPSHFIIGYTNDGATYGPPVVVGYDAYGIAVYGQGYTREILSYDESGNPVYGNVIAVPYTVYVTEYQQQQVAVQVAVGSEPVPMTDESGNPVYDAGGNIVYATDENGNIIYRTIYETQYVTQTVAVQVPQTVTPEDPSHFIISTQGSPIYGAPVILGYDESNQPIIGAGYGLVNGIVSAIPYTAYQTEFQQQEVWVPPSNGGLSLVDTTPAYTPGYTIPGTPNTYSASDNTDPGSTAISLSAGEQATTQSLSVTSAAADSARPIVKMTLDRWGNVVEVTDPRSLYWKTTYTYNANSQVTSVHRPDAEGRSDDANASITQYRYDALGRQVATVDANGNVNSQDYDADGNLIAEHQADGGTVTHAYDAFGNRVVTMDAVGNDLLAQALATPISVIKLLLNAKAQLHRTDFKYDDLGHLTEARHGAVERYDVLNHVGDQIFQLVNDTNQLVDLGSQQLTEQYSYDELGRRVSVTNGNGEVTRTGYDLRGNVIAMTQPLGQVTRSAFDANNDKIAEIDANGLLATWSYDYFGQLTGRTDIGGASYSYTYDGARQLVEQSNTRGQHRTSAYDGAGQLVQLDDLALNQTSKYSYDLAGNKLLEQTWQAGELYQDNRMAYDAQGRLRLVTGLSGVRMEFTFDKAGNRIRQQGKLLQTHADGSVSEDGYDHWYAYDAMNRQTAVDAIDAQGHISQTQGHQLSYDKNGNRINDTHGGTLVNASGGTPVLAGYTAYVIDAETGQHVTLMDEGNTPHVFQTSDIAYDGSGRPYVVSLSSADGGTYYVGGVEEYYVTPAVTYQGVAGIVTERYAYDAMDRLASVSRDDAPAAIDKRLYDGAGRVVQTGPNGGVAQKWFDAAGADVNSQTRINRYDLDGRLQHQTVLRADNSAVNEIAYTRYDAVGNLLQYRLRQHADEGFTNTYDYDLQRLDGYKEGVIHGSSTLFEAGTTTDQYDVNGFLVGVNDATKGENNRAIVNDASGMVLLATQNGQAQRELVVNGQLMGRYGVGIDELKPRDDDGNPRFAPVADFTPTFRSIDGNYPTASVGSYTVVAGDTLQGIAQAAYGDSRLWWKIAQANGIGSASELRVGQTLSIPSAVAGSHNGNGDYRIYDPTKVVGDTTPNLPSPSGDDCGGLGTLLVIIVAVVVTVVTAGAAATALGVVMTEVSAASVAVAAGAAAVGSIVSQAVGIAIGVQKDFSWKGVALAAISAGVTQGVSPGLITGEYQGAGGWQGAAARAAVANAATQAVGVATGLQKHFDWRGVAASAVGAAAGSAVGGAVGDALKNSGWGEFAQKLATGAAAGLASGTAAAVARGGRIVVRQVATDAFGNALGSSLAEAASSGSQQEPVAGSGLKLGGGGNTGLRLSGSAVDAWSRQVDEGIASSAAAMRGDWTTGGIVADGVTVYDDGSSPHVIGAREGDLLASNGTGLRKPSSGQPLTMVPRELQALRDPAVLADPAALRRLYNVALDNSRAWLPTSLSPEETSLTTGVAYQKVFGEDRTAIWFGLAPYATSKVGETYQQLDKVGLLDRTDASIIRSGFREGNRAIFESMFTAEQFYQAGGTEAIRAMVELDNRSFGANWTARNVDYANSLVQSFELRDQAKAAFAAGQAGRGEDLLGQSLRASADFEQRAVLQQYYDKSYTASSNAETKTLRQAIQDAFKIPEAGGALSAWDRPGWNLAVEAYAQRASTVTINGHSLSFTGRDVGDVNQRMPFVYSLADNLMNTYRSAGDWLSGSQRIYQDQFNVLQKTYGADAVFSVRQRLGFH